LGNVLKVLRSWFGVIGVIFVFVVVVTLLILKRRETQVGVFVPHGGNKGKDWATAEAGEGYSIGKERVGGGVAVEGGKGRRWWQCE